MSSIQGGTAQVVGTGPVLALSFSDCQSLNLAARTHAIYISYSEGGLEQDSTRYKLQKLNDSTAEGPDGMTITFNTPTSGILYFASAGAGSATVHMWAISCGKMGY